MDGARYASLPADVWLALDIAEGEVLEGGPLESLAAAAEQETAFEAGLRLLSVQGRSTRELTRKLRQRGWSAGAVSSALGRLERAGYLDDEQYARNYVEVRMGRGEGPALISAGLQRRGVDRQTAERAVAAVLGDVDYDQEQAAREVASKRAPRLRDLPTPVARRRLMQYLGRRGFPGATVRQVVDDVLGLE